MREVADRRQQLEFEHEQALAVLTFKQDEVRRLQRAQFVAKKEQEGVVQMLETTLDTMQSKVLELEEKCRNQSKQFSLLSRELERFRLQAETFEPGSCTSLSDLDLHQLSSGAKCAEAMPSFAYTPIGLAFGRPERAPTVRHRELPTLGAKSAPAAQCPAFIGSPSPKSECSLPRSREAFPPQGAAACSVPHLEDLNTQASKAPPRLFITKYSYNPYEGPNENPDVELPLTAGECVFIHGDMDNDGFYRGELADGRRGLVPSTFVEPVRQHSEMSVHPPAAVQQVSCLSPSLPCLRTNSPEMTEPPTPCVDAFDLAFEPDAEEEGADAVPYPRRLNVIKQLAKSVVIGWEPPLVPPGWGDVLSYDVLVDGELRLSVPFGSQTKAVLERLDVQLKTYRISVRSVTGRGVSDHLRCSLLVGRDACVAPTQLKVDHVTSTSARLSWLPSNSNYVHMVMLNGSEWQLVKAGRYSVCLINLRPNQSYSVKVEARSAHTPWELPPHRREHRSATSSFSTLIAGPPQPPSDVQLEVGPSPGIAQISWTPVPTDSAGDLKGAQVTGYAIYADKRKILEVSSPMASSVLMGPSQMEILETASELAVRTMSPHGESASSVPVHVLPDLLSAIMLGVTQAPCVGTPVGKVPSLLRNPPLGAPANSTDCCPAIHVDSTSGVTVSAETMPSNPEQSQTLADNQGDQQVTLLSALENPDQIMLISGSSVTTASALSLKFPKREGQEEKSRVSALPDIQEEEEPYSDTPGEESGGAGGKPNACETDSDEELLESLVKFPFQAPSSKQLFSIAEVTEEEDSGEEWQQAGRPVSPQIQQLASWLQDSGTYVSETAPPEGRPQAELCQGIGCEPKGGDPPASDSVPQHPEVSELGPESKVHSHGDQGGESPGMSKDQHERGRTLQAAVRPQRRVHYSDIVESISYQEEEFDSDCSLDAPRVRRAPEKVRRSYHLQGSHKGGDRLRREVLQKSLMWHNQPQPGPYLGGKTVARTRAHSGSGMEISLEYGTEDDDESLLGDPVDVVMQQMSSEWWLEGGHPKCIQGLRSCSGHLEARTSNVSGVVDPQVLNNATIHSGVAHALPRPPRRGRAEASGPDSPYKEKMCHRNKDGEKPCHIRAKPEQRYCSRDGHERDTYGDGGESSAVSAPTREGLRRQSQKRTHLRTRQLREAAREQDRVPGDTSSRIFVALFPYDPTTMSPNLEMAEEELPFTEGQVIQVYGDKDADGFYYGESDGHFGYVPCNMVSEIQVEDEETRCQLLQRGFLPVEVPVEKTGPDSAALHSEEQVPRKMVAIFDYDPRESSPNMDVEAELTFSAGDIIYVFGNMDNDGFFYGELNGQRGLVPSNFLQALPDMEAQKDPGQQGRRRSVRYKR